jgi:hypothetical protein
MPAAQHQVRKPAGILRDGLWPGGQGGERVHTYMAVFRPGSPNLVSGMRKGSGVTIYIDRVAVSKTTKLQYSHAGAVVTSEQIPWTVIDTSLLLGPIRGTFTTRSTAPGHTLAFTHRQATLPPMAGRGQRHGGN